MKRSVLGIILLLCHLIAAGQSARFSLEGTVMSESDQPLEDAIVYLNPSREFKMTSQGGKFIFTDLLEGKYQLIFRRMGYQEVKDSIFLNKSLNLSYRLVSKDVHLEVLEVIGHKEEILSTQPAQNLTGVELDQRKGETLGAALTSITGVNVLQTGSTIAKPVIHGMHSNRVLILNNGIRQEGQQWGVEHAPEIDPFIASDLTVIKGAAGVQYGPDAIGGVILVQPPKLPRDPEISGEINLIGMSNGRSGTISGMVQGGVKRIPELAWRIQGTLKKAGNLKTPDYYLDNTGMTEKNVSGFISYDRKKWGADLYYSRFDTRLGILSVSHVGNITDLNKIIENGEPFDADQYEFSYEIDRPFQNVTHDLVRVTGHYEFYKQSRLHLTYGWQNNHREEFDLVRQSISASGKPQLDFRLKTRTLDVHWSHKISNSISGTFGIDGMKQSNVYKGRQLIPNFRAYRGGVYLIEHFIKSKYELEGGFRFDYQFVETFRNKNDSIINDESTYQNISGVLGGTYQVGKNLDLKVSAASAWRPPNVNELFSEGVHQGVASFELGNPDLEPEQAYNLNFSSSYQGKSISGEVNLYSNYINNYIFLEPQAPDVVVTIQGAFPLFEYKQVDATFRGVDVGLSLKILENLLWQAKGSIVRAKNLDMDEPLIFIPADKLENNLTFNFQDLSKFVNSYIGISNILVAKQTRLPEQEDFAPAPDGYCLFDFKFGADIPFGKSVLGFGFEIKNLFNQRYRDYLNLFRYFVDEPGRNFIIRLKFTF